MFDDEDYSAALNYRHNLTILDNCFMHSWILMWLLVLTMHTRLFWFVRKCCLCQISWSKGLTLLHCWTSYLGHH